jgi:putative peptidoglycan lipid II flippase
MASKSQELSNTYIYGKRKVLLQASVVIMTATMLSRVLGLAKNIIVAGYFGAGSTMDAFWIAMLIPMFLIQMVSVGAGNITPIFTHEFVQNSKKRAWDFCNQIVGLHLLIILIGVVCIVSISTPLVKIIAPGAIQDVQQLAITLTKILVAIAFFQGLFEVFSFLFYAQEKFMYPAIAGIVNNVFIIGTLLLLHNSVGVYALVYGVVFGSVSQLLILIPGMWKFRFHFRPKLTFGHEVFKGFRQLTFPRYISQFGIYLNEFADKFFASLLPVGAISALSYAFMVVELPSSAIILSLNKAAFPSICAKLSEKNKTEALQNTLSWLNMLVIIIIPFTLTFLILGKPIVQLIFERGVFDASSTHRTWQGLLFYSFGLPATTISAFLGLVFWADKDTKIPVKLGLIRISVNIVLNALLIKPMGIAGLALATSLSGYLKMILSKIFFDKKYSSVNWQPFYAALKKAIFSGVLFSIALIVGWHFTFEIFYLGVLITKAFILFLISSSALLLYLISLFFLRQKEVVSAWKFVSKYSFNKF